VASSCVLSFSLTGETKSNETKAWRFIFLGCLHAKPLQNTINARIATCLYLVFVWQGHEFMQSLASGCSTSLSRVHVFLDLFCRSRHIFIKPEGNRSHVHFRHTRTKLQDCAAVHVNLIMQQCGSACSFDMQTGYGHRTKVVCRSVYVACDTSMMSQIPCCLCIEQMYTRMQNAYAIESTVC
jgi:hypothetical protein